MQCSMFTAVGCVVLGAIKTVAQVAKPVVSSATSAATESIIDKWANTMLQAVDETFQQVGTFWVKVETPDVAADGEVAQWGMSVTAWLAIVVGVFALIFASGMLVWNQRGETIKQIISGQVTLMMVSTGGVAAVAAIIEISDAAAVWFVEQGTGTADGSFTETFMSASEQTHGAVGPGVIIMVGIIGVLANLVQLVMMYMRSAMLVLLVVMLPLAAAGSMCDFGRQWLRKTLTWLMSFALLKPVAGLIYAISYKMSALADDSSALEAIILSVMMMVMAAFALPSLVKLMTPAAAALGGGSGVGGVLAAGGALATGAMQLRDVTHTSSSSYSSSAGLSGGSGSNPAGSGGPGGGGSGADDSSASGSVSSASGTGGADSGTSKDDGGLERSAGAGGVSPGGEGAASTSGSVGSAGAAAAGAGRAGASSAGAAGAAAGAGAAVGTGGASVAVQAAAGAVKTAAEAAGAVASEATGSQEVSE